MMRAKIFLPYLTVLSIFYMSAEQSSVARRAPVIRNQDPAPSEAVVELAPVLADLNQPVYMTGAGDGSNRIFVVELSGRIKVLMLDAASPTIFLDITGKVGAGGENGLLGLAFHPQYVNNRRFYVSYTRRSDSALVVAEYRASKSNPNAAQPNERTLLVIPQPSNIHHGGMIDFGPDNFLYVSTGDGFWEDPDGSAQDKESLRGKMLRIDVDNPGGGTPYSSPSDNPFFGSAPGRDEVYALGFRNPWRFSFDRLTGLLYVGDVGHEKREEINLVVTGGNYGWRIFEGTLCTSFEAPMCDTLQPDPPVIEYDHAGGRCSITAGYVYRGAKGTLPPGSYVYGDFCTGEIFLAEGAVSRLLLDTSLNITSFGEDEAGEIYVVGIGGTVQRLLNPSAQEQPVRIDSIQIRNISTGEILEPVVVKKKGKKFEVVVRGAGFTSDTTILINGDEMKIESVSQDGSGLIARLRADTLSRPGALVVEAVTSAGIRSNEHVVEVRIKPNR